MNLGLVHPYIYYLNIFIFTIFISGWLLSFLKIESLIINSILISANYIGIISLSILNSIFIIFFFSAGYLMNIDLAISVLMIGLYVYVANEFINLWRVLFKEHDDFLSEAQIEIKYKLQTNSQGWNLIFSIGTIVLSLIILDKEERRKKYKSMSSEESQELIFKKMKNKVIEVGSGVPNKKYDSEEVYELIHIANCFPELREKDS